MNSSIINTSASATSAVVSSVGKSSAKFLKFGVAGLAVAVAAIGVGVAIKAVKSHKSKPSPSTEPKTNPEPKGAPVDDNEPNDIDNVPVRAMLDEFAENAIKEADPELRPEATCKVIKANFNFLAGAIHSEEEAGKVTRVMTDKCAAHQMRERLLGGRTLLEEFLQQTSADNRISLDSGRKLYLAMTQIYVSTNIPVWAVRLMVREVVRLLPEDVQADAVTRISDWGYEPPERPLIDGVPANVVDHKSAIKQFAKNMERFYDASIGKLPIHNDDDEEV